MGFGKYFYCCLPAASQPQTGGTEKGVVVIGTVYGICIICLRPGLKWPPGGGRFSNDLLLFTEDTVPGVQSGAKCCCVVDLVLRCAAGCLCSELLLFRGCVLECWLFCTEFVVVLGRGRKFIYYIRNSWCLSWVLVFGCLLVCFDSKLLVF